MSDEDEKLKMHMQFGGLMSKEGNKLCYKGVSSAPDMLVDPDFLTFSIFEDFTKNREVRCDEEKVWYGLPHEDISVARSIWQDKDNEIMNMASEAKECGEVYIYVEHSASPPNVVVDGVSLVTDVGENDGEKADDEDGSEEEDREEEESEESEESDGENREKESDEEEREEDRQKEDRETSIETQSIHTRRLMGSKSHRK